LGNKPLEIQLTTRRDTRRFGKSLSQVLQIGDLVVFQGDLGAGKTFLIRAIARGLGVPTSIPITSPTFELVHELPGVLPILHVDLYRLEATEQLFELGLLERINVDAIVLVEWGDRFWDALGNDGLGIQISISSETGRFVKVHSRGKGGDRLLERLRSYLNSDC